MYKNLLIGILSVAVIVFTIIAIKNSKPIECTDIVYTYDSERKALCIIEFTDASPEEIHKALQIKYQIEELN